MKPGNNNGHNAKWDNNADNNHGDVPGARKEAVPLAKIDEHSGIVMPKTMTALRIWMDNTTAEC